MCRFLILKSLLIESFKVVSLFNYQGSVCFSLLLYSLAQLLYPITPPSLCQQLFLKVFYVSRRRSHSNFYMIAFCKSFVNTFFEFFQLYSSRFLVLHSCRILFFAVCLRQLCYDTTWKPICQYLFCNFFIFFAQLIQFINSTVFYCFFLPYPMHPVNCTSFHNIF